ncbi:hypothetical protein ACFXPE_19060 [Streptomyces scopuliridis]|uniref:hypothetical protein n=2 Tax=Streptomyces scopuliridis TaxID=452529 RepID=UPI0036B664A8
MTSSPSGNQRPTDPEKELGAALLAAVKAHDAAPPVPATMPSSDDPILWWTQRAVRLAALSRIANEILRPAGPEATAGRMGTLVRRYRQTAEGFDDIAQRLAADWETAPPPEPSVRERQLHPETYWTAPVIQWEQQRVTQEERTRMQDAEGRLRYEIEPAIEALVKAAASRP